MKTADPAGLRFGEWTVLGKDPDKSGNWICQCSCGKILSRTSSSLKDGRSQSCGCKRDRELSQKCIKDLTGMRFGKLTVIDQAGIAPRTPNDKRRGMWWNCKCDCGKDCKVLAEAMLAGKTKSCGCLIYSTEGKHTTHKLSHTRIYNAYSGMIARCYDPSAISYKLYGARGIQVCDEWRQDRTKFFEWAMNNGYSDDLTLDRIDNNGNYCPENCKWSTKKEQANNTRRNVHITYQGETHTLAEWADIVGIPYKSLHNRIHRNGWTIDRAFTQPLRKY